MTVSTKANGSNGCYDKAGYDEPIFVLRAQDASAAGVLVFWINNNPQLEGQKLQDARDTLQAMLEWPVKKQAD